MNLPTPDATQRTQVTILNKSVTEIPGFRREITVRGGNVGASEWKRLIDASQVDGLERHINVYQNPLTKKFIPGSTIVGTKKGFKTGRDVPIETSDIKGVGTYLFPVVTHVHTHPMLEDRAHLVTDIPSDHDFGLVLDKPQISSFLILDRSGAHLLIRTRERMEHEPLPPKDLIKQTVKEIEARGGLSTDVQKRLSALFSPYGVEYFYAEGLETAEDGTITFKKP